MCLLANNYKLFKKRIWFSGANINLRDSWGRTALQFAKGYSGPNVVRILMDAGRVLRTFYNTFTTLSCAFTPCKIGCFCNRRKNPRKVAATTYSNNPGYFIAYLKYHRCSSWIPSCGREYDMAYLRLCDLTGARDWYCCVSLQLSHNLQWEMIFLYWFFHFKIRRALFNTRAHAWRVAEKEIIIFERMSTFGLILNEFLVSGLLFSCDW